MSMIEIKSKINAEHRYLVFASDRRFFEENDAFGAAHIAQVEKSRAIWYDDS